MFLSADDAWGNDVLLGTFAHAGSVDSEATYAQVQSVRLPESLAAGNYTIFIQADAFNQVNEPTGEGNNVGRLQTPIQVALAPVADLVVTAAAGPDVAAIGQPAVVRWTVRNAGGAAALGPWTDRVYLSRDGSLQGAALLGSFLHDGDLAEGLDAQASAAVTLPAWNDGDYWLVVVADATGRVFERNGEDDNSGVSANTIHLSHPDLLVSEVEPVGQHESGTTFSVRWRVRNAGSGPTPDAWTDKLYLSTDAALSADDALLGSLAHSGVLGAGKQYAVPAELLVTLPDAIQGTRYLLVASDAADVVQEGAGEGNNAAPSNAFAVTLAPYADLEVSNVLAQERLIGDPVDLTVSWTVRNLGTGAGRSDTWVDRVWLSSDGVLGGGDRLLGEYLHVGAMPAGTEYTETRVITLPPATQGRYSLLVQTDATDLVYEYTDARPNVAGPAHPVDVMRISYADLVVNEVVADPVGQNAQTIHLTWTVSNEGIGPTDSGSWTDRVWLATDAQGSGWVDLGSVSHLGVLEAGASYVRSAEVTLPTDAAGTRYLFVTTGGPFEFIYDNNTNHSGPIQVNYVPPPTFDLEVKSVVGPASGEDAQEVDVTWTVRNLGPDPLATPWYDTLYLAPDGNLNQAVSLGRFSHGQGLLAGRQYTRTERVRLPAAIQGLDQVFLRTDSAAEVAESREDNNLRGADDPTTVTLRARPDLQVTSLVAPNRATGGGVIDVEFTVKNLGAVATPTGGSRWTDRVYVSLNHTLDGGDRLLGTIQNGSALEPGEGYTSRGVFRLPPEIAGNVYVIVAADAGGAVDETPRDGNNALAVPLAVDVTPVPPPDLVVSDVAGPTEAVDGDSILVHYKVTNRGAGITYPGSWVDAEPSGRAVGGRVHLRFRQPRLRGADRQRGDLSGVEEAPRRKPRFP